MQLQESGEMYLETIYILANKHERVRSLDVAQYMGFSKPSVSRAMKLLKDGEFITVEDDGSIHLTKIGEDLAKKTYEKHTILTKCLIYLGVDEETATEDACKMEHYISDKSFDAIKKHLKDYGK